MKMSTNQSDDLIFKSEQIHENSSKIPSQPFISLLKNIK